MIGAARLRSEDVLEALADTFANAFADLACPFSRADADVLACLGAALSHRARAVNRMPSHKVTRALSGARGEIACALPRPLADVARAAARVAARAPAMLVRVSDLGVGRRGLIGCGLAGSRLARRWRPGSQEERQASDNQPL